MCNLFFFTKRNPKKWELFMLESAFKRPMRELVVWRFLYSVQVDPSMVVRNQNQSGFIPCFNSCQTFSLSLSRILANSKLCFRVAWRRCDRILWAPFPDTRTERLSTAPSTDLKHVRCPFLKQKFSSSLFSIVTSIAPKLASLIWWKFENKMNMK